MDRLTYEQRKRAIFDFLYGKDGGLLRRYRTPEHMSDDALRNEVNMLVADVNRHVPGWLDTDFRWCGCAGFTVESTGSARVFTEDPRGRRLGRERAIRKGLQRVACPAGRVLHFGRK